MGETDQPYICPASQEQLRQEGGFIVCAGFVCAGMLVKDKFAPPWEPNSQIIVSQFISADTIEQFAFVTQ